MGPRQYRISLSTCLVLFALYSCVACQGRGRVSRSVSSRDAAVAASRPDAEAPSAPIRTLAPARELDDGCRCAEVVARGIDDGAQARHAMVMAMDSLNDAARRFVEGVDVALGPQDAPFADARPHREALAGLRCQLDCLLSQLLGFTRPAWSYLEQVARFLDLSAQAVTHLSLPIRERSPGPGGAAIAEEFNALAKLSNLSVGLMLVAPAKPTAVEELDSVAFRAKTRRWVSATEAIFKVSGQSCGGSKEKEPSVKVIHGPMALRVSHAWIRQELSRRIEEGRALKCARGEACAPLWDRFQGAISAAQDMVKASLGADAALRAVGDRALAPSERAALCGPLKAAHKAWHRAIEGQREGP